MSSTALFIFKSSFHILIIIFFIPGIKIYPQQREGIGKNRPISFNFDVSADGKVGFGNIDPGFGLGEARIRSTLFFKSNYSLVSVLKSKPSPGESWKNRNLELSQLYAQYNNTFNVFSRNLTINLNAGKLEWYPNISEPQLIIENYDLFTNPPFLYGGSLRADYILFEKGLLSAHLGAYGGYVSNMDYKVEIPDANLLTDYEVLKNTGIHLQIGRTTGARHFINESYLFFRPLLYNTVRFDLRAGKLPGFDNTPYGIHIGAEGIYKYLALGLFWEKRLNQEKQSEYFGFSWRIIGPEELAFLFNTFQILYDTNTKTLRFLIPFLNVTFK